MKGRSLRVLERFFPHSKAGDSGRSTSEVSTEGRNVRAISHPKNGQEAQSIAVHEEPEEEWRTSNWLLSGVLLVAP